VPLIESSPAFGRDGVIIIVYDEDERMGGLAAKNGFGQGVWGAKINVLPARP
jgi:hypothetical protein